MYEVMFKDRKPDFSRLKKVLTRGGEPDYVPFYELFADNEVVEAILGRPAVTLEDHVEYAVKLGYDYVGAGVGNLVFPQKGLAVTDDTAGTSRKKRLYRLSSISTIESWEDFEKYPWPDPAKADYSSLERLEKIIPEGMKAIVLTGHVLEQPMGILGYEPLCYMMADDPELVEAIFQKNGEIYEAIYKACAQMDVIGAMLISDDLGFKTAPMLSPEALRKLVFPWYKRYVEICHEYDKPVILHSCGNLELIMDDLLDYCKIDAKHSYEDTIMPVTDFKKKYGDRVSVLGGIDVHFLCTATEDEVRKRTRETLEACMPGGGYGLGTGNSVANYIPVRNFLAMLDEGNKVGRYI